MGQNSTEVAYGFGQLGSAYVNLTGMPVYPPKGHVICAIQFVAANSLSKLHTETLDNLGPQFITIEDDELKSAGGPDANYVGVTEAACNAAGSSVGVVTLTAANPDIKVGQVIIIGQDDDDIDTGIEIDDAAYGGTRIVPIYQGPNKQGLVVKSISGTTLTIEHMGGGVFDATNLANDNTLYFLDEYHGAGGTTIEGTSFPTGIVIYGRWTEVELGASDADGGIICYFGK